jgi:hypothetical protein
MNAPTTYTRAAITGHSRSEVLATLRQQQRVGRVASAGQLTLITTGPHAGEYGVPVLLINRARANAPAWAKIAIVTGCCLIALAAVGALLSWLFTSLTTQPLLLLILGALVGLGWLIRRGSPRRATVTTTTTISWR